jgi:hypothetical protein
MLKKKATFMNVKDLIETKTKPGTSPDPDPDSGADSGDSGDGPTNEP